VEEKNNHENIKKNVINREENICKGVKHLFLISQFDYVGPWGLGNFLNVYPQWFDAYNKRNAGEGVDVLCSDEIDKEWMLMIEEDIKKYKV
jgi:hypothetical protein